jgi:hypothetical protein
VTGAVGRNRSTDVQTHDLTGSSAAMGAVPVDRDPDRPGVAQHDIEVVLAICQALVTVDDSLDEDATVAARDLDVARGPGVPDQQRVRGEVVGMVRLPLVVAAVMGSMLLLGVRAQKRLHRWRRDRAR